MRRKDGTSKTFLVVLLSLLISITSLVIIYIFQISTLGYGIYLYILVMVSAVIYILSTIIFVLQSVKKGS